MPNVSADDKNKRLLKNQERLRKIMRDLPELCFDFLLSIESNTSILTRINYAGDLRIFFDYLHQENVFSTQPSEIGVKEISLITSRHIEMFMDYLNIYRRDDKILANENLGKKRKLSSIRSFFKYLLKHKYIESDPSSIIDTPKVREKPIVHLTLDEVDRLLNVVENGQELTKRQQSFYELTRERDAAIITLLLGTGIRISECVGLDIADIELDANRFRVQRKGGKTAILYFSDEVKRSLEAYAIQRVKIPALPGYENAFFLSLQRKRITERSVQNLVQKFTQKAVPLKKITPHKFRSTFGTELYKATGDIYLVADVLGHKDVNTTRKHYADMSEENRHKAANAFQLRKNK